MPEHLFYAHDFGAVFEQVCSKAMAEHVRARFTFPTDFAEQVLDVVSKRAQAERLAVFAQEYVARGSGHVPRLHLYLSVICDAVDETFGKWNNAFLVTLAEHAYEFGVSVDAVPGEILAFRNAEPGSVDELEQNARPYLREFCVGRQFRKFFFGQVLLSKNVHQALGAFGHGDVFGRILFANFALDQVLAETL